METAVIDIDWGSLAMKAQQMINTGEIELRTEKERTVHKITRVKYDRRHGIQVTMGRLYSNWFTPNRRTKDDILNDIFYFFRELAAQY